MKIIITSIILCLSVLGNTLPSEQRKTNKSMQATLSPVQKYLQESSAVFYDSKKRVPFVYGTIVSSEGLILTKASELDEVEEFYIRIGAERYKEPTILNKNETWDLALVKIEAEGLIPVKLDGNSEVELGTWTVSNGASDRKTRRPRPGIISANKREIKGGSPAVLGVGFKMEDDRITITKITEDSGAERAGLEKGDLIIGFDGKEVGDDKEFIELLKAKAAGEVVKLKVQRDGEVLELDVELMARHKLFGGPQSRNDSMSGNFSERRSSFPMVLQHETMLSARSVGGPLFTLDGRFLGMNIAAANRVEAFAIPVEDLSSSLSKMKAASGL